ncbi:BnaA09g29460D [Brassica napus]|uniref:BnaA09g29460D protein n=1 Tax=Brassica napus TaxID=3708 RepID=A0A078FTN5_BRANA|nr:BnaA09g29460D [Brassica napus]
MAMQAGVSLSRILILAGAGYTGTIMMKNGKLSDILGELQSLVKGMERSEGDYDDSDAVASQVRRLAMEVRQLASARQITVMDGVSGANLQALVVPAAVLGVLGYGYMWWKGLAFTDLMYVTKANMATAVANLTKNLEQVSVTLAAAKRHLTQKIQSMDDKVEKQIDLSKGVKNQVTLAREDINSLELDLASLNNLISGLDGKLDTLEYKQDVTNVCMLHLYNYFGGKSTKLPDMEQLQLQLPVNQKARNLLADVETKGLKNFAEELLGSNGTEEGGATTVKIIGITKSNDKSRPLLSSSLEAATIKPKDHFITAEEKAKQDTSFSSKGNVGQGSSKYISEQRAFTDDEDESLVSDEELDPKENLFPAGRVFLRDRPYGPVLQSRFEDPAMLPFRLVSVNHDHHEEPSLSSSRFEDPIMLPFRLVSVNHDHREELSLSSESRLL